MHSKNKQKEKKKKPEKVNISGTRRHVTLFKCVSDQWACGGKLSARCARLPVCSQLHCPCPSSCPTSTISITERLTKKTCNRRTSTTSPAALIFPVL